MPPRARVVIYGMGTNRGPGKVLAVIEDPSNLGASLYFNAPGEMYFTLKINHPQAGSIEPWRTHYAVQEYVNGTWAQRFEGLVTDFDANDNDVIFYGIDYLALLDKVIDTRYVKGEPDRAYNQTPPGSKYPNVVVSDIIGNLLNYARAKTDSPVGFIPIGGRDLFSEKIVIYSTFTAIASFIQGLVEAHRAGTGARSRLWCERYAPGGGQPYAYRWMLRNNVGVDRKGIRLTYGGMVQGFNIIGFGDFATKAHGIGRRQHGFELFYKSAGAPGMSTSTYGAIETVGFHDNLSDENDLHRRVKQAAATAGKVGKRVALGLKVDGLRPLSGYGVGDNVVVDIKRGVVDTMRYGSGLWTVHGVEWRVFPDGHDELTLVVLPKEDGVAPNPDLLVAQEVLPAPISVGQIPDNSLTVDKIADGAITTPKLADDAVSTDKIADDAVSTDKIADDAVTGDQIAEGSLTADHFAPGVIPGVDADPPAVPTGLALTSEVAAGSDGHTILRLIASLTQPGDADLYGTWVEVTNKDDGAGNPDWDWPMLLFVPATQSAVAVEGAVGATLYWARAQSVDRAGNRSAYTSTVDHTTVRDTTAPPMPDSLDVTPGYRGFGASWPASAVPDLMFNEVRWSPDDGTGTAPSGTWSLMRVRSNVVFVSGLTPDQLYWVQVRSVDLSGNVVTSASDPTAVDYLANPEAGWVAAVSVTPLLIGSTDIAADSITAVHIAAGSLDAADIGAGTLVIRPLDSFARGIEVQDADGDLLGRWDENGLKIIDPSDPTRYILVDSGQVKLTTDGGSTFDTAITPDGINASLINFGEGPGGHNVVLNSSFELADFAAAPSTNVFTGNGAGDWVSGQRVTAPENLTEGATALTISTVGYA